MNIIPVRIKTILVFIVSAVVLVSYSHRAFAEIYNRVVAVVNDEVITLYELNKRIEEITGFTAENMRAEDEKGFLETRRRILELLIDERIAREKIHELGIQITPSQVDAAIENIKKNSRLTHEDLINGLKKEGITFEKYRETIKKDLERIRLINYEVKSKIIIREEQIRKYYQQHKEMFHVEEQVHLAGIFLRRKNPNEKDEIRELSRRGEEILARLRTGENFGKLAGEYSEGPGADEGGDLGQYKSAQLDPELRKIVEIMSEGEVSDLIIRENGIHIIKLIEKNEAKVKSFEEVRDSLYEILYKEEVNRRYMSWIKGLRKNSYTKIIF